MSTFENRSMYIMMNHREVVEYVVYLLVVSLEHTSVFALGRLAFRNEKKHNILHEHKTQGLEICFTSWGLVLIPCIFRSSYRAVSHKKLGWVFQVRTLGLLFLLKICIR